MELILYYPFYTIDSSCDVACFVFKCIVYQFLVLFFFNRSTFNCVVNRRLFHMYWGIDHNDFFWLLDQVLSWPLDQALGFFCSLYCLAIDCNTFNNYVVNISCINEPILYCPFYIIESSLFWVEIIVYKIIIVWNLSTSHCAWLSNISLMKWVFFIVFFVIENSSYSFWNMSSCMHRITHA